ncbi:MAG: LarC family nickel insertion protein [Tropicimonas sp.]|uniref:LarC family nickel insertion protein n=1 Tax=Tropicimonas sp. TaxID=2067044 RepID=UPI003A83C5D0
MPAEACYRGGMYHLHLDPLGGIAGDMLLAALLDARPDLLGEATTLAARIGPGVELALEEGRGKGMRGQRLRLSLPEPGRGPRHYPDYCALLRETAPDERVAERALDILRRLGEAEAKVHGVALERVHFHEISDWDSIADILLNAFMLERTGVRSASAAPVPLGSGRLRTEHGSMPVPAPATLELLRGIAVIDDGIAGERVTPTGAALLAHLAPSPARPAGPQFLEATGYGLGNRELDGCANLLRVSLWQGARQGDGQDRVAVISFHVDDQTPEDLAVALERLRGRGDVLDVLQGAAQGKKGRLTAMIEVICPPESEADVVAACFAETATIGLRIRSERRHLLARRETVVDTAHGPVRVKRVSHGAGTTAIKAESDDIAPAGDRMARNRLRREAETPTE